MDFNKESTDLSLRRCVDSSFLLAAKDCKLRKAQLIVIDVN
jgi:hypothetical protein